MQRNCTAIPYPSTASPRPKVVMQTLAHENLRESHGSLCRDVIVPNLKVLFCGINPSLMSAAVGHHFARPGNRFWRTLAGADLTPRLLRPEEDQILPQFGIGITNLVARATRTAAELSPSEYRSGMRTLTAKVAQYRPTHNRLCRYRRLSTRHTGTKGFYWAPAARDWRGERLGTPQSQRVEWPLPATTID